MKRKILKPNWNRQQLDDMNANFEFLFSDANQVLDDAEKKMDDLIKKYDSKNAEIVAKFEDDTDTLLSELRVQQEQFLEESDTILADVKNKIDNLDDDLDSIIASFEDNKIQIDALDIQIKEQAEHIEKKLGELNVEFEEFDLKWSDRLSELDEELHDIKQAVVDTNAKIETDLTEHIDDKNNPHNVTAEQIQARKIADSYSKEETDEQIKNSPVATEKANGLMSFEDKINLDLLLNLKNSKQVFSGASFFKAGNIATWNESDMEFGLYIVVSGYEKGAALDAFYQEFFISKKSIQTHHKTNFRFIMNDGTARKVFYPGLTEIRGNDINGDSPHNAFVVREIYVV